MLDSYLDSFLSLVDLLLVPLYVLLQPFDLVIQPLLAVQQRLNVLPLVLYIALQCQKLLLHDAVLPLQAQRRLLLRGQLTVIPSASYMVYHIVYHMVYHVVETRRREVGEEKGEEEGEDEGEEGDDRE